jgi:hypothetical protein
MLDGRWKVGEAIRQDAEYINFDMADNPSKKHN